MEKEILDQELVEFCRWYKDYYGKAESYESAMITCLCGRFHTFPKQAKKILSRLVDMDLVTIKRHMVNLK